MTFKKLDDLPKHPHSYKEIMKAMAELHRQATAQSHAYGGKNSKLLPVGIAENSLLQSVNGTSAEDFDDLYDLIMAEDSVQELAEFLAENDEAMKLLSKVLLSYAKVFSRD